MDSDSPANWPIFVNQLRLPPIQSVLPPSTWLIKIAVRVAAFPQAERGASSEYDPNTIPTYVRQFSDILSYLLKPQSRIQRFSPSLCLFQFVLLLANPHHREEPLNKKKAYSCNELIRSCARCIQFAERSSTISESNRVGHCARRNFSPKDKRRGSFSPRQS